jgi:hypothetical protein
MCLVASTKTTATSICPTPSPCRDLPAVQQLLELPRAPAPPAREKYDRAQAPVSQHVQSHANILADEAATSNSALSVDVPNADRPYPIALAYVVPLGDVFWHW